MSQSKTSTLPCLYQEWSFQTCTDSFLPLCVPIIILFVVPFSSFHFSIFFRNIISCVAWALPMIHHNIELLQFIKALPAI